MNSKKCYVTLSRPQLLKCYVLFERPLPYSLHDRLFRCHLLAYSDHQGAIYHCKEKNERRRNMLGVNISFILGSKSGVGE